MDDKLKNIGCAVGLPLLLLPVVFSVIAIKLMTLKTDYTEKEWFSITFLHPMSSSRHQDLLTTI
ncbi:hypothetical protein J2X14_001847 [Pantoea alhagi]|nr:hypothetical protein [Pantoea alhagi]